MNEKEFKRLLTSYLDGELSTEEIISLKKAVEETPSYRHFFQDEIRLHTLLREVVSEKIEEKKISTKPKRLPFRKTPKPKPIFAYIFAAVAALTITGFILGFYLTQSNGKQIGICVQIPNEGEHDVVRDGRKISLHKDMELFEKDRIVSNGSGGTMLLLSDGSMVSLEEDTEVSLSEKADVQVSLLQGEILLEVSERKRGQAPFKVKTLDSTMTVLGTIFAVNSKQSGFTKLSVYDGNVELQRLNDAKKVQVNVNESVITSDQNLQIIPIEESVIDEVKPEKIDLLPSDDVSIDGRKVHNDSLLKVRKGERTIYLKFKLQNIGPLKKAVLKMTQQVDPGSGTLFFHLGDNNNWTEDTLRHDQAPRPKELIARRTGAVVGGKTIAVDLSKSIKGDGVYTIIITLSKGEAYDIWFSSKEGSRPPVLQLTR